MPAGAGHGGAPHLPARQYDDGLDDRLLRQAVLSGLFAAFSRFTRTTFLVYGIALLPFFWFNYYFVFVVPLLNAWMALDFLCNVAMLALCFLGYRSSAEV